MAAVLRSAAAAGRAIRHGVSAPTRPIYVLSITFEPSNYKPRVWEDKLEDTTKNLGKGDLVRESTESLILDRQKKIGAYNLGNVWVAAGVGFAGYMFGTTAGAKYVRMEGDGFVQKIKCAMRG
uniref:Uncharacterized protein n=1 Tax=Oryza punctata TaxID=4537 RepID=A0A0E0LG74_ORYPU